MQITNGRGTTLRRLIWWPQHGQIAVRLLFSDRWLGLKWYGRS